MPCVQRMGEEISVNLLGGWMAISSYRIAGNKELSPANVKLILMTSRDVESKSKQRSGHSVKIKVLGPALPPAANDAAGKVAKHAASWIIVARVILSEVNLLVR